jgi:hypothetical protein
MRLGAYYNRRDEDIVWFRPERSMASGFYHRHTRPEEPPNVYIAESRLQFAPIIVCHTALMNAATN